MIQIFAGLLGGDLNRTYAELRATDPEGNNFDLAEGGFERAPRAKAGAAQT